MWAERKPVKQCHAAKCDPLGDYPCCGKAGWCGVRAARNKTRAKNLRSCAAWRGVRTTSLVFVLLFVDLLATVVLVVV